MPRIPKPQDNNCCCHIPASISEDVKLKVLEERLLADITSETTIGETFTTDVTVGHLTAGESIDSAETLKHILLRILKPTGELVMSSITVSTPPTTTEYIEGDELDLTGIAVKISYEGSTYEKTVYLDQFESEGITTCPENGEELSSIARVVSITCTQNGVTKSALQNIYVTPQVQNVKVYSGAVDALPTSLSGIHYDEVAVSELIKAEGYGINIKAGNANGDGQIIIIAIPKTFSIISWKSSGFHLPFELSTDLVEDNRLYYIKTKSYDLPNGIDYVINVQIDLGD